MSRSSYVDMDHAAWVQAQIAAARRHKPTAHERRLAAEHKGWHAAPERLTPFQCRAFNILGIVGGGIYNAPIGWSAVYWDTRGAMLSVPWRNGLGTFDFEELTRLVFLCHEARIRAYVDKNGPRTMEIHLSQRAATGGYVDRHPNLDEAVADFRSWLGPDHPIVYREPGA